MFGFFTYDTERDGVLLFTDDGRAFVAIGDSLRAFSDASDPPDDAVLLAANRAWASNQELFRPVQARVAPVATVTASPGIAGNLTDADRRRLHLIIIKHHRAYFPELPTAAQMDNLIDGLGAEVAARIVKGAVDSRRIN